MVLFWIDHNVKFAVYKKLNDNCGTKSNACLVMSYLHMLLQFRH